jgi:hypothetical protein
MSEGGRRRIFLGPAQMGHLQGIDDVLNNPKIMEYLELPKIDLSGIFFSTMIQCGVEEFVLVSNSYREVLGDLNSDFLSNRVVFDKNLFETYLGIHCKVLYQFAEYEEDESLDEKDKSELFKTETFLADLLFQMKTNLGSASIFKGGPPDLKRLKTILSPEMYYPLQNLFSSYETDNLRLPLPTQSILHQNIKNYEKIIDSDIFSKYSLAHQNLQNNKLPKSTALKQICYNANKLQIRFQRYLSLKELAISSFNKIPIGAELFGGKIGGLAAEGLLKLFEPLYKNGLSNNQRHIRYEFSEISKDIIKERIFTRVKNIENSQ